MAGKKTAKKKTAAKPAASSQSQLPSEPASEAPAKKSSKKATAKKATAKKAGKKASSKKAANVRAQIGLDAITIEGGLLSPSWLSRIAQASAPHQSELDYAVPKGLTLRDEIGRYWRIAQAHWAEFEQGRASPPPAAGDMPGLFDRIPDEAALVRRFVLGLLRECFGFASIREVEPLELDERSYPIGHSALEGRVPIVLAPAGLGLDTPDVAFGEDKRRRSPFGLLQEYLNADEAALWGLVCDGLTLRVVRDNASLTRPAWIEVDLARIFAENRHAEFAALWLLLHASRFGRPDQPVTECALEAWRNAGVEEGTRARDFLRKGVEDALLALGQGFLAHPANRELRSALEAGSLTKADYFNQLLRVVYRVIFLLTIEERGLLHAPGSDEQAQALYAEGYGLRRLRDRAVRRNAHDRFSDLWESVKIVFRSLAKGEPRLALPALAGLFAAKQCPDLDTAKLENHVFLAAMYRLSWIRQDGALARVNWRDMGPEELGSVYESLLELVPRISKDGREFGWARADESKGNARKTSGSYYTPESLVQVLLDNALEPVIADTIARNPERTVEALLELSIVDPACGSGHFLLGAARRLAGHVARHQVSGTPSPADYRHAVRQVVGRCIYGVDQSAMAVELCKVSLWMEAVDPGLPLSFLDSHIQQGNSLLGTTPDLMAQGIPDSAWEPIDGDDLKVAADLKKRNRKSNAAQESLDALWAPQLSEHSTFLSEESKRIESASDQTATDLALKEGRWITLLSSPQYTASHLRADLWCAAFVWPKRLGDAADHAPTNDLWHRIVRGEEPSAVAKNITAEIRTLYQFFHWHLQFPTVFDRGGFDAVIGNPPWEQIQLDAREFFSERDPEIARARHHSARQDALSSLEESDPALYRDYKDALRKNGGVRHMLHACGRHPETTTGRLNTAPLFAETATRLISQHGLMAVIVPSGIATDSFTQRFFSGLVETGKLKAILSFENEDKIFPGVDHRVNFCILCAGGARQNSHAIKVGSYLRGAADVHDENRVIELTRADFSLFNPNSGTCPTFRTRRDLEINRRMYTRGVLVDETASTSPWAFRGLLMFMMNTDSGSFAEEAISSHVPLFEAKMISSYNHRYGDFSLLAPGEREHILPAVPDLSLQDPAYENTPRYWVPSTEVDGRLDQVWPRNWLIGWRDVTDARSSVRTVVATIIPRVGAGHTIPLFITDQTTQFVCCLLANMCSFALDYATRQKLGGTHLTYTYIKQLPILPPSEYAAKVPWHSCMDIVGWLSPRVVELTYTSWMLADFASDAGFDCPPFRWSVARRLTIRCEIDAAMFHLYQLSRDEVDYVMDTFPIVRKNDEKAHGEYRTKRLILEIYDEMAEAIRTGKPYQTRLDPPPADPSLTHPPREPAKAPSKKR